MTRLVVLVGLALALLVSACSTVGSPEAPKPSRQGQPAVAEGRSDQLTADSSNRAGGSGAPAASSNPSAPRSTSNMAEAAIPPLDRMVIANVNLSLSVENAIDAARAAERTAERYGGFVAGSNLRDSDAGREATLTLRLPSARLSEALSDLRSIGRKVTDESRATQDVTEEFTDIESNVRNLRSTETQILALMERATKIEEVLALQRELTGIRGQIERLEGRRRVLENRSDFATISIRLVEPLASAPRDGWSPLETAAQALAALSRFAERLGTLAIWLLVFLPIYGPAAAATWWLTRRARAAAGTTPAPASRG